MFRIIEIIYIYFFLYITSVENNIWNEIKTCEHQSKNKVVRYSDNKCYLKDFLIQLYSNMNCEEKNKSCESHSNKCDDIRCCWNFDTKEFDSFPLDTVKENYIRRDVKNAIFSAVDPTPLEPPVGLALVSHAILDMLDLDTKVTETEDFIGMVSGGWIHPSSTPFAHRYGGHQFGWWAEQLGDGRAHLLGVYKNRNRKRYELQLKGSGLTPYSRSGDGRAVIRSSVREFLAAEFMAALGFRTSRCLSLAIGNGVVMRDMFYTGNVKMEKTAVVLRIAESWFRFGSLEILTRRNEIDNLKLLLKHVITTHYHSDVDVSDPNCYLQLYSKIVEETALMIAEWQSIGFTHGVMNTDNMSLLSVTIDYGPFGYLDDYNPNFIPNSSDDEGLYRYKNQPKIGFTNLQKLGKALLPLLTSDQVANSIIILNGYNALFKKIHSELFLKKLGINNLKSFNLEDTDPLIVSFLQILELEKSDFSNTFWELGNISMDDLKRNKIPSNFWSLSAITKNEKFADFMTLYEEYLNGGSMSDDERRKLMNEVNPRYILRNWMAQNAIKSAEFNDFTELKFLYQVLINPFEINPEAEKKGFGHPPPKWAKKLKVSCSS